MKVKVDGMVWLPMDEMTINQIDNIREQLIVYPRKTTDIAKKDPEPIFMYEERGGYLVVPRGYYSEVITKRHDEELDISLGYPMSDLSTRYKSEGPYVEQGAVIRIFEHKMEGKEWGGFLLKAGCAFGKALCHGEPVLVPGGYVPIENLCVGDFVAGTDGGFHRVEGVYPQGERVCYRVEFTDGTHVDCDEDHLWTFEKRRSRGKIVTISTKELAGSSLKEASGRVFWLPDREPVRFFSGYDLPVSPYTMGALLGDGSFCGGSIRFYSEDGIENDMDLPDGCHFVEVDGNSGAAKTYRIVSDGDSNALVNEMKKLGLFGMDSHRKWIPTEYRCASVKDRLSLLQGLFDTDGSPISSGLVEYSTASCDMAHNVKFVVESLGGTCVMAERDTFYKDIHGEKVGPFHSYRLTVKLPRDMRPFRVERKQAVIDSAVWQRRIGRAVDSVTLLPGKRLATCISVDSPDRLFLTRGCVPTHNTATALEFARRLGRRTLILVHKDFFLKQWKKRIEYFMPDASVGIVRQSKCDFEGNDFVIAMLQSLARDDGGKYPEEFYRAFGLVISDECHRISASTWSWVIPRFNAAWRLGLSATPRRKDATQDVFFNHISKVTYSAKTKARVPNLRILRTHGRLRPISRGKYQVSVRNLNSAQILTQLGNDEFRAKDIVDDLVLAVQNGRKVMVVSERIAHLKLMSDMLTNSLFNMKLPFMPRVDFYTGEWFTGRQWETTTKGHKKGDPEIKKRSEDDLERAESANVIFACVTDDVECLTDAGWKCRDELEIGELVATYNVDIQSIEYVPLREVCSYVYDSRKDGPMLHVDRRVLDVKMTRNHRNIVSCQVVEGGKHKRVEKIKIAEDLVSTDKLRVAAPMIPPDLSRSIGTDMAELLGWIISEGSFPVKGYQVFLYQNKGTRGEERIECLLDSLGMKRGRKEYAPGKIMWWLYADETRLIKSIIPDKKLTRELVWLPKEEAFALFDGLMAGDGHCRKDDRRLSFIQKSKETTDWFSVLSMRLGYHVSIGHDGNAYRVYLSTRTHVGLRDKDFHVKDVEHKGIVWCPVTDNGTWIARSPKSHMKKGSTIFITGNTKQMVEEGLDIEALDVVVLALPMSDVEQTVGRVRRWCFAEKSKCERLCPWRAGSCQEKPSPIVLDVLDEDIPQLFPKWRARQRFYTRIGTMGKKGKSDEGAGN
jgi:hypothetical protein